MHPSLHVANVLAGQSQSSSDTWVCGDVAEAGRYAIAHALEAFHSVLEFHSFVALVQDAKSSTKTCMESRLQNLQPSKSYVH